MTEGGIIGWVYYVAGEFEDFEEDNTLSRVNIETQVIEEIYEAPMNWVLNKVNDRIYFVSSDGIYSIKFGENQAKKIIDAEADIFWIQVSGKAIYFVEYYETNDNQYVYDFYKSDLNGKKKEFLWSSDYDLSDCLFSNGCIYYINSEENKTTICKLDSRTKKNQVLRVKDMFYSLDNLIIEGTDIYYQEEGEDDFDYIKKMDLSGENDTILTENTGWYFYIDGEWLYFSEGGKINKVKTDGSQKTTEFTVPSQLSSNAYFEGVSIEAYFDGWIYYSERYNFTDIWGISILNEVENPVPIINASKAVTKNTMIDSALTYEKDGWLFGYSGFTDTEDNYTFKTFMSRQDGSKFKWLT